MLGLIKLNCKFVWRKKGLCWLGFAKQEKVRAFNYFFKILGYRGDPKTKFLRLFLSAVRLFVRPKKNFS